MSEPAPVATLEEFRALDEGEILDGYMDGILGERLRDGCSRAFLHGWRNGMVDSARAQPDLAYRALEREFEARRCLH